MRESKSYPKEIHSKERTKNRYERRAEEVGVAMCEQEIAKKKCPIDK